MVRISPSWDTSYLAIGQVNGECIGIRIGIWFWFEIFFLTGSKDRRGHKQRGTSEVEKFSQTAGLNGRSRGGIVFFNSSPADCLNFKDMWNI
jgi:hypothetical protein